MIIMYCGKSRFKVPATVVAMHYARYYSGQFKEDYASNVDGALHDNTTIKEWLNNNMSTGDLGTNVVRLEGRIEDLRLPCDRIEIVEEEETSLPPATR